MASCWRTPFWTPWHALTALTVSDDHLTVPSMFLMHPRRVALRPAVLLHQRLDQSSCLDGERFVVNIPMQH